MRGTFSLIRSFPRRAHVKESYSSLPAARERPAAYRSRGRMNRNLWLVYSQKTNRDWILRSDRHLVLLHADGGH
jgi:hypothetical protein